jgi:putative hemolysin
VAGFILSHLARMAELGDIVAAGDVVLEVAALDGHRITRVRVHRAPE